MTGQANDRTRGWACVRRGPVQVVVLCLLTGLALVAGGCDNSGGPASSPERIDFNFFPTPDSLGVNSSVYLDFRVTASPPVTFSVDWTLDGQPVAVGPNFRFFPPDLGPMLLQAHAYHEDRSARHQWWINVTNTHPLEFSFDPPADDVVLVAGEDRRFRVLDQWPFDVTYRWHHAGQVVGSDSTWVFAAEALGPDSLRVAVEAAGLVFGHSWQLTVEPYRPPTVSEVLAVDGPTGGSVQIVWLSVTPVVQPVSGYEVAASFTGPITEENWDQVLHLGRFDHTADGVWLRQTFTEAENGLIPGARAWFGVRSFDDQGSLSGLAVNADIVVPLSWWAGGQVRDELGVPLAGALIQDDLQLFAEVTDAEGRYRIGPFAGHQSVRLRTVTPDVDLPGQPGTSWHDYRTGNLTMAMEASRPVDFTLITAYGADPSCASNEGSFLTYLRYMTRTSITTTLRPNYRLYKWDHYPLTVFIPEFMGEGGVDFRANCALTLAMWNTSMGEDYFTQVDDAEAADVVFLFADFGNLANGQASLLLPDDEAWQLGDVVPEKMQVYVHNTLDDDQRVQETALHELGHVLGLNRHSLCNNTGYLMYITANGVLDNGPENAIHLDERRAVRTIRYLPQG